MTLLAKNLLLVAVGVFLVACMWQWQLYQMGAVRERLTKQAIAELPPAEQHGAFPVIVHFDPSFVPEGLVAAGIGCVGYRLNLRQTKTSSRHPIGLSAMIACVVAALRLVLSMGAVAIGTMLALQT